jgi:hypothetical protein
MAAAPQKEPMPPDCTLDNGCTISFAAISPTTGAAITGVTVSNANIYVQSVSGTVDISSGPFMLVPGPDA